MKLIYSQFADSTHLSLSGGVHFALRMSAIPLAYLEGGKLSPFSNFLSLLHPFPGNVLKGTILHLNVAYPDRTVFTMYAKDEVTIS